MRRRYALSGAIQLGLVGVFVAALFVTAPPRPEPASAGTEVLPDLAMAPLSDFRIETVNGRRLLRFTAMMVNVGSGHFEVRGSREGPADQMRVDQIIFETTARDSPVARRLPTEAEAKWSGDGHDHWHVQEMMRYDLWGGRGTFRGAKVGFCFLDSDPWNLSLPGAGPFSYYRGSWCQNTPSALSYRMGISVGWGDEYEYYLAWQWVDVTDLPSGAYTIRAKVDPYGFFVEEDDENQCGYTRLSFTTTSNAVTVLGRGSQCINDWEGASLASHIAWMFETGLTAGCAPDLYCTYNPVTRGQMAAFLARALDLAPTPTDYFTDDDGSTFELSINRLAAAGISAGCAEGRFCPNRHVTRGEMAAFLSRAYQLPPTTTDYFTDDDGSTFELSINRVTAAGIATGCAATRFCPDREVNRAEMAAFLHRAAPD
jgi:hypothetical protein